MHDQHQQLVSAIRVVLAKDGVLLRDGLAGLLWRFGFHVVAMAGDGSAYVGSNPTSATTCEKRRTPGRRSTPTGTCSSATAWSASWRPG